MHFHLSHSCAFNFYADKNEGIPLPELGACPVCRSLSGTCVPPSVFHFCFHFSPSDSFITAEGSDADTSIRAA